MTGFIDDEADTDERSANRNTSEWTAPNFIRISLICRMAFNYCRPLLLGDDPSSSLGRRFLQHPMSNVTDGRLVSAVELLSGRSESPASGKGMITHFGSKKSPYLLGTSRYGCRTDL